MERFFEAPHLWKPATVVSHRPVVGALIADPFARRRLIALIAGDVRPPAALAVGGRLRGYRFRPLAGASLSDVLGPR